MRRLPAGLWLDGLIGALAVAALGAAVVFGAVLSDTHGAPLTVATNLAYPLADLLLLGILVGMIALTGWTGLADWGPMAFGFVVFAIIDSIYLIEVADNSYTPNRILDVGWPGALVILALAAWRRPPQRRRDYIEGWGVLSVPTAAAVACLALMVDDHYHHITHAAQAMATACLLTVVARLGVSFAENQRMLAATRREAVTDALSGLRNRRALKLEPEQRLADPEVAPFVLAIYDLDGFKAYNDSFGHQAGDALLARLGARAAAALPRAGVYRMGGDEFCVIAATEEAAAIAARALAERNGDLGQHNDDVAELVEAVGAELGLAPAELVSVRRAAELHDVGKLAIPDAILAKPGPLDPDEWAYMRGHTIVGERIVASATSLQDVAPIVRSTHERWDGGGYPDGRAGEAIPLGARIIAVCDAYDAMTTSRPYRTARSHETALAELRRECGRQFDPRIVEVFEHVLARQLAGTRSSAQVARSVAWAGSATPA